MKNDVKKSALPYIGLYGVALVVCLLGRVGLAVMDATGALSYNYRTATAPYLTEGISTLDKLCMASTGGTLIGFIFAGGMALCLAVASALLFAHLFQGDNEGGIGVALIWGFATAVVSFICLFATVLGLFSRVQLSQMSGSGGSLGIIMLLLFLCVGTLVAAASVVLRAATVRGATPGKKVVWTIVFAAVCGAVVCVLTVGAFSAINAVPANGGAVVGWLLASVVANVAMLFVGARLGAQKGAAA